MGMYRHSHCFLTKIFLSFLFRKERKSIVSFEKNKASAFKNQQFGVRAYVYIKIVETHEKMCGILVLFRPVDTDTSKQQFLKENARGPEETNWVVHSVMDKNEYEHDIVFGFHRLAINGYKNPNSMQPLFYDNCILVCNGEIYNYTHLLDVMNVECASGSDCQVIIHMYKRYGFQSTLQHLDGVFAFVLYDIEKDLLFVARDPLGVRPLFETNNLAKYEFASELKMFANTTESQFSCITNAPSQGTQQFETFQPGTFTVIQNEQASTYTYFNVHACFPSCIETFCAETAFAYIRTLFESAVAKRVKNTDRNVACLLSGGVDSSLVAAIAQNILSKSGKKLYTWSIGLSGSQDLVNAQLVASHIGSHHTGIELTAEEFLNSIDTVIQTIESYDVTTVRASVGNWLVGKYIREKNEDDTRVLLNGDGSDELCGGYLYFHKAPDCVVFDAECKRLLHDIHYFDVLRSDRCISAHGLEPRTPFLDKNFVKAYLSHPMASRMPRYGFEKYALRKCFDDNTTLPHQVLYRRKEAFSDGVSQLQNSWSDILKKHILDKHGMSEAAYYQFKFSQYYPHVNMSIVPYKWMPQFVENADDPSARTLDIY